MPRAGKPDRPAEHPVAFERQQLPDETVRPLWPGDPGANAEQGEVGLVAEPFEQLRARPHKRQLGAGADDRPGIEIYDRALLRRELQLRLPVRVTAKRSIILPAITVPFNQSPKPRRTPGFVYWSTGIRDAMPGELILLPVRLYFRAARFALRTSLRATEQAVALATDVIRSVTPDGSGEVPERPATNGAAAPPLPGRNSHALAARGGGRGAATELVENGFVTGVVLSCDGGLRLT